MHTPWFVYLILFIVIVIAVAVTFVACMDPAGRTGKVATNSFCLAALLCIGLVILAVRDVVRWISTS